MNIVYGDEGLRALLNGVLPMKDYVAANPEARAAMARDPRIQRDISNNFATYQKAVVKAANPGDKMYHKVIQFWVKHFNANETWGTHAFQDWRKIYDDELGKLAGGAKVTSEETMAAAAEKTNTLFREKVLSDPCTTTRPQKRSTPRRAGCSRTTNIYTPVSERVGRQRNSPPRIRRSPPLMPMPFPVSRRALCHIRQPASISLRGQRSSLRPTLRKRSHGDFWLHPVVSEKNMTDLEIAAGLDGSVWRRAFGGNILPTVLATWVTPRCPYWTLSLPI